MNPIDYAEKIRKILHLSTADYYGKSRKQPLAWKRQVAMYLTYENTDTTFEEVRGIFYKKCYTTVLWARTAVINRIENDIQDGMFVDYLKYRAAKL